MRANSLDAVTITHAHPDHTGYLPALIRDGYDGPTYATGGTAELSALVSPDNGHLLEEEAQYAARPGSSIHHPPTSLYTAADAGKSLKTFKVQKFDVPL